MCVNTDKKEKGEFLGECNRTACDNKRAQFYNHSTQKYYCTPCARIINTHNYTDAIRLYGHNLCILQEIPETEK